MSDLISREAIIHEIQLIEKELLQEKKDAYENEDEQVVFAIDNQLSALWRARLKAMGLETAYDVDKVVEQLVEAHDRIYVNDDVELGIKRGIYTAISIVKGAVK